MSPSFDEARDKEAYRVHRAIVRLKTLHHFPLGLIQAESWQAGLPNAGRLKVEHMKWTKYGRVRKACGCKRRSLGRAKNVFS